MVGTLLWGIVITASIFATLFVIFLVYLHFDANRPPESMEELRLREIEKWRKSRRRDEMFDDVVLMLFFVMLVLLIIMIFVDGSGADQ